MCSRWREVLPLERSAPAGEKCSRWKEVLPLERGAPASRASEATLRWCLVVNPQMKKVRCEAVVESPLCPFMQKPLSL